MYIDEHFDDNHTSLEVEFMRQMFTVGPYIPPPDPQPVIDVLKTHGTPRRVRRGDLLKAAEESGRLFLVEEGLCCYLSTCTPHPYIPFLMTPGCTMGDITTLGHRNYAIEWRALSDSTIIVVPPRVLEDVLTNPTLRALKIQHLISKEESSLEGMSANFTLEPAIRLRVLFQQLIEATGTLTEGWMPIPYRLTAECLGMVVNLTRANVSRLISEWGHQELVHRMGQDLEVHAALFNNLPDWQSKSWREQAPTRFS